MTIDDRLRAASKALKESSVAQVDAASRLREIVRRTGQPVAHGRTAVLLDEPQEAPTPLASPLPPATQPRRTPQRLALAVNLLLVLALGILVGITATNVQGADRTAATPATSTASTQPTNPAPTAAASTGVATPPKIKTQVPQACLDAQEAADEVISRLDRNDRDKRLFSALRDYTIASQACRRAASP
jgi:pyruvate/2-oxoglutarate dehydrogenase complex dihydrolipoamide acyltransferase (E2) component